MNKVEISEIKNYIQNYFSEIFSESVTIEIKGNSYVLNNSLSFDIYDFWNKKDEELFDDFNDFSFNNDYIGTIFFFLSGYWEYNHYDIKDKFGRFPSREGFQFKTGVIEEPVVEILCGKIKKILDLNYKSHKTEVFLTHDIDHLSYLSGKSFIRSLGGDILKRKDFKVFFEKIVRKIRNDDPFSVYNLLNIHKKYGTKGTFFFMPKVQPALFEGGYNVAENAEYFKNLENDILLNGSAIGIHYDVGHINEKDMKKDIKALNSVFKSNINSGRAHYLLFDIRKSFDVYESSGIKTDSSCGYSDISGFRFGTCKPFKPYNFNEKCEYNFYEYPLIVMDGTLQNENCMNLTPEKGFEKIKEIIDKIACYNGVFTFLWHNSSFYTYYWKNWEWVYEETIKYCKERDYKFI